MQLTAPEIERMTAGIAEVLAQHRMPWPLFNRMAKTVPCSCTTKSEWGNYETPREAHERHVARKIAEWLAEQK